MDAIRFPKPVRVEKERKPLRRGSRLQAKTWMKRRRPRRLDRKDREVMVNDFDGQGPRLEVKDGHDEARLRWCRTEPCVIAQLYRGERRRCVGPSQSCHEGEKKRGTSTVSNDKASFPMCGQHHLEWTDHVGFFKGWSPERRRGFGDEQGAAAHARYLSNGNRRAR